MEARTPIPSDASEFTGLPRGLANGFLLVPFVSDELPRRAPSREIVSEHSHLVEGRAVRKSFAPLVGLILLAIASMAPRCAGEDGHREDTASAADVAALAESLRETQSRLTTAEQRLVASEQRRAQVEQRLVALEQRVAQLQQSLVALTQQSQQIQQQQMQQQAQLQQTQEAVRRINNQIGMARRRIRGMMGQ